MGHRQIVYDLREFHPSGYFDLRLFRLVGGYWLPAQLL
jgi:hypothetical protein